MIIPALPFKFVGIRQKATADAICNKLYNLGFNYKMDQVEDPPWAKYPTGIKLWRIEVYSNPSETRYSKCGGELQRLCQWVCDHNIDVFIKWM